MNQSQRALFAAHELENQLLLKSKGDKYEIENLRLIGFCLSRLKCRNIKLEYRDDLDIIELLNFNDIHHRRVSKPDNLSSNNWQLNQNQNNEYPMMIVFDAESNMPLALYREKGENWLYSAHLEKMWRIDENSNLGEIGYEIYPSLPPNVDGPFSVLKFAFSADIKAIIALVIASAVVMIFNLSIPMLTNTLVEKILPQNDQKLLLQGVVVVMLIVAGSVATSYLQSLMMLRIESVADLRLQSAVWDRLMRLPMSFIKKYSTGDLSSRVNSISQIRQLLGNGVLSTSISTLFSLSYFVLMFAYDSYLALWASLFTLIAVISNLYITYKTISLQMPLIETGAEITNFSLQTVMGMPQIRSSGSEPFVLLRWMKEVNKYALLQLRTNVYTDAVEQYGILVSPIASLFLFALVAYRILSGSDASNLNLIIVSFISFNAAFSAFNGSVTSVANLLANTAGHVAVLWKRAEPVLYADVEKGYQPDSLHRNLIGDYQLQNISYAYPESSKLLFNNLSFSIPAGKHTAITGPSGCGKTTLVRMLLGFSFPDSGEILVDGVPLSQLAIRSYRRQMGVVMQTAHVNNGSIYDVVCGGLNYSMDEVWEALERAAIAEEIRAMPMQLETLLSDSGGNVSGGQVQRIAIARALITSPKVLIMDEATSALDNKSQQHITDVINNLGITRISIAHRLSTIKNANQIIVINKEAPVESGNWNELQNHGYIQKMLRSA